MSPKKKSRSKRSDEELRKASDFLKYEIWMFRSLAEMMASGLPKESDKDKLLFNAILDSFLIRTRALLSFFYADYPYEDDAIAEDYFSSSKEWLKIRPVKSDFLEEVHKRISKSVAHISYKRHKKPEWNCSRIATEIDMAIDKFLSDVPKHLLGSRWK